MPDLEGAWLVRITDLPVGWPEAQAAVAVNCHVRHDVAGLDEDAVQRLLLPTGRTKHARELHLFANEMLAGDLVIAVSGRRDRVLVGEVAGAYEYRPDALPQQPHQRRVRWLDATTKADLDEQGLRRPGRSEAFSVGRLRRGAPSAVPAPSPRRARATIGSTTGRWVDDGIATEPVIDCPVGRCDRHTVHRYLLEVPLVAAPAEGRHLLVVGANPSCPDEEWSGNFLRALQPIATHLGAASVGIVNLITRRTPKLSSLRYEPAGELVGPRQQDVLARALGQADVVLLAHGYGVQPGQVGRAFAAQREALHDMLRQRPALAVLTVGDREHHPRTWSFQGGDVARRLQPWSRR